MAQIQRRSTILKTTFLVMTIVKIMALSATLKNSSEALVECAALTSGGRIKPDGISAMKPYGDMLSSESLAQDLLNSQSNLRKLIASRPISRKFRRSIADNLSSKTTAAAAAAVDPSISKSALQSTDDLRAKLANDEFSAAKNIIYRYLQDDNRGPVEVHINQPVVVMKLLGQLLSEIGNTMYQDMLQ